MKTTNHVERLLNHATKDSQRLLGSGWNHVSTDIQQALVIEKIARMIAGYADEISAEKALANLRAALALVDSQ